MYTTNVLGIKIVDFSPIFPFRSCLYFIVHKYNGNFYFMFWCLFQKYICSWRLPRPLQKFYPFVISQLFIQVYIWSSINLSFNCSISSYLEPKEDLLRVQLLYSSWLFSFSNKSHMSNPSSYCRQNRIEWIQCSSELFSKKHQSYVIFWIKNHVISPNCDLFNSMLTDMTTDTNLAYMENSAMV